jgi:ribosomal protein S6
MNESTPESKTDSKVYEIGYLLVPTLPQEKVGEQASALAAILEKHSAVVIAEEAPTLISLAYEMDRSSGGGTHQRFNQGYFGWIKFYCSPSVIEEIRKSFDQNPHILRTLAISTVREKTYLGKRAKSDNKAEEKPAQTVSFDEAKSSVEPIVAVPAAPMTTAEIAAVDKSIDEMVKGA